MAFNRVLCFASVLSLVCSSVAFPSAVERSPDRTLGKRASCTPPAAGVTTTDDVPAIVAAIQSCGNGGTIVIPAGKTYNIRTPLEFTGCVSCDFQIEGTLKASDDVTYWSGQSNIILMNDVTGAKFHSVTGTGLIDGNGQAAYDAFAANSSLARPTLHVIQGASSNIQVYDLKVVNAPNAFFTVKGDSESISYSGLTMTAASTSSNAPKNTDGFDIGASSYVTISNTSVSNQDDCVAFKPGTNYATVSDITCVGSHGISVGSLGDSHGTTDVVQNVYVTGATMTTSTKAVGIKLYPAGPDHGSATVSNVTFDGVVVNDSDYAAQIQSCYSETTSYCTSYPSNATVTGVYFKNFSGTTSTEYSGVLTNIDCPAAGTCDVYFSDWTVKPGSGTAEYLCANIDNSDPGITCTSGASG